METSKNIYTKSLEFIKGKYATLIGILLVPAVIRLISDIFEALLDTNIFSNISTVGIITSAILFLVYLCVAIVFGNASRIAPYGFIKNSKMGNTLTAIGTYKMYWRKWWDVVVISIVLGTVILGGFFLLIVPGIMLAILFGFSLIAMVVKDKKPVDAAAYSWMIVSGRKWDFVKKDISGLFRIGFVYALAWLVSMSIWGYMFFKDNFLDHMIAYGILLGLNLLVLIVWGFRVTALYNVYSYHLFEEFERTAVILGEVAYDSLKKRIRKYAWIGLIAVLGGLFLFGFLASLNFARVASEKAENQPAQSAMQYQIGDFDFSTPNTWVRDEANTDAQHTFTEYKIGGLDIGYIQFSSTPKSVPVSFADIVEYLSAQTSQYESLKKQGAIVSYKINTNSAMQMSEMSVPYVVLSATGFSEAIKANVVTTAVSFEHGDFIYDISYICLEDSIAVCNESLNLVMDSMELKK